jgi:hypothetical protein
VPGQPRVGRAAAGSGPPGRRLASPPRWERALLGMLWAGLTTEQISRLADLRVRLRLGACAGDGETWPPGALATRRLEFACWLEQTGRLRDW